MTNRIKKGVAYARFSSDMQREESIDAQLRAIQNYAAQMNIIIVGQYIDRAKTATSDHRPEFLRMIEDSNKKEFDVVFVHKLDRFARNRYDSAFYKHQLKRNGIKVFSVLEHLDDSPESVLLESMIEGLNEYYSKNLAREVEKGKVENALKAKHIGGRPPLGYDVDYNTMDLVLNEKEADIVRLIYGRVIEGIGYASIADELNRKGYKTKGGRNFSQNSILSIIRNPKYTGDYVYNRFASKNVDGRRNGSSFKDKSEWIVVPDAIPAIVSREDFEYIQQKREGNKRKFLGHKAIEEYLLSGKIVCDCCGAAYVGERRWDKRREKPYVKYMCNIRKRQGKSVCPSTPIDRDQLESYVLRMLAREIFCEEMLERITGYYHQYCDSLDDEAMDNLERLGKKQEQLDKDIEALLDLITQTRSEALLGRLVRLEDEKRELKTQIESMWGIAETKRLTEEELIGAFDMARLLMRQGLLHNLKRLVELFIERVVVGQDSIIIKFKFAREYHTGGLPPKIGQCRELQEKLLSGHGENALQREVRQNESQCVVKTTHWRGGEGLPPCASTTYKAFINQLKIVCERNEAQHYNQNPPIAVVYLPHFKATAT